MRVLAALGDPTRIRIVELLAEHERSVTELREHFSLSQPAMSQHLKVLRDAQLAQARVDGQRRVYSLRADGVDELTTWLDHVRGFWSRRLSNLDDHLDGHP
jgi:DNA-binding transcriptional ArsR family regulator